MRDIKIRDINVFVNVGENDIDIEKEKEEEKDWINEIQTGLNY